MTDPTDRDAWRPARDGDTPGQLAPGEDDVTSQPRLDRDAIRARADAANNEIASLADGSKRWKMTIPADPSRDSDLVLSASLADIPLLLDALAAAEAERDEARALLSSNGGEWHAFLAAVRADGLRLVAKSVPEWTPEGGLTADDVRAYLLQSAQILDHAAGRHAEAGTGG